MNDETLVRMIESVAFGGDAPSPMSMEQIKKLLSEWRQCRERGEEPSEDLQGQVWNLIRLIADDKLALQAQKDEELK